MRHAHGAAALLALLVVAAAVPSVEAIHRGERDRNFNDHYTVRGRIVNETGWPLGGVQVSATLLGLTSIDETDCGGDFTLYVPVVQTLHRFDEITLKAQDQTRKITLDDGEHTRRSDVKITGKGEMPRRCLTDRVVEAWEYRYTVEIRIVERVAEFEDEGVKLRSKPSKDERVRITLLAKWKNETGADRHGVYEGSLRGNPLTTDAAGNAAFSFTVASEIEGGFKLQSRNVTKMNATLKDRELAIPEPDYFHRVSYFNILRGDDVNPTPLPPAAWALLAAGAAALLLAGRRRAA